MENYKGFAYVQDHQEEDDCSKIFHDVLDAATNKYVFSISDYIRTSPYKSATVEEFHAAVDKHLEINA